MSGDILDLLRSPEGLADPYAIYDQLRTGDPVHRTGQGTYMLTRYRDCAHVLKDPRTFRGPAPAEMTSAYPRASRHLSLQVLISQNLLGLSGAEHARLRACMTRSLTPRRVQDLQEMITSVCGAYLSRLRAQLDGGVSVNFHEHLSVPFPLAVFARLAGLPDGDLGWYARILPQILKSGDPAATEAELDEADCAVADLQAYITDLSARRRRAPGNDLVSALAMMPDLTADQAAMLSMALLIGGFETTAAAIDNGMLALLSAGPPARWPPAPPDHLAGELLRYDSPAQCNPGVRLAAHDTVIGGVPILAGSDVRVMLGAANRDPAAFPRPHRIDPARTGPGMLTFGAGRHYCPGAALAQLELSTMWALTAGQLPTLQLAGEPVRRRSTVLRAVDDLPVTLGKP